MRSRTVVLVVAVVALVAMTTTGAQSFTAGELDRDFVVGVVSDEDAYLGIVSGTAESQGATDAIIDVTNDIPSEATVWVTVTPISDPVNATSAAIDAGETHRFRFSNVTCDASFTIAATGDTADVELTRTVPCTVP